MSLFSDISGFNAKAIKNIYESKDETKEDFSEVDFCINDDNIFSENEIDTQFSDEFEICNFDEKADLQDVIEDYMYNYNMTAEEAEEYITRNNMNTEG